MSIQSGQIQALGSCSHRAPLKAFKARDHCARTGLIRNRPQFVRTHALVRLPELLFNSFGLRIQGDNRRLFRVDNFSCTGNVRIVP